MTKRYLFIGAKSLFLFLFIAAFVLNSSQVSQAEMYGPPYPGYCDDPSLDFFDFSYPVYKEGNFSIDIGVSYDWFRDPLLDDPFGASPSGIGCQFNWSF